MAQVYSMTSFARGQIQAEWGTAVWEMRSVNQRFLESFFRMPDNFRELEFNLRERLRGKLNRGKLECSLKIEWATSQASLEVNRPMLDELVSLRAALAQQFEQVAPVEPLELLRWPGVLQGRSIAMDVVQNSIQALFDSTLQDLIRARAGEGSALAELLRQRLAGIREQVARVNHEMPQILQWQRERLTQKLLDVAQELNRDRLEQELVLQAQKLDVAEEMDRLLTHVNEVERMLTEGGAIGRRLDFLMQELNREANTLSSKSINSQTTGAAIDMKVLIEQMREQVQNIE